MNGCFAACLLAAGCASPFHDEELLRQSVQDSVAREVRALPESADDQAWRITTQPPSDVQAELADRREELDAIGPFVLARSEEYDLGPDLLGTDQQRVAVGLQSAIVSAVHNNLSIQQARLQPAINESDVIAAEAAFDAVWFASAELTKIDEPQAVPVLRGVQLGALFNQGETYRFETGIRKPLITGGEVYVSTDVTRFRNNSPGIALLPDPAYTSFVRLGISQPLLRGFGSEVNTATIRLSRNMERRSIQQLRADMLQLVADTESAYWDLVFAWYDLSIRQWLVDVGAEVRDVLERRREFDTRLAQYADAVATVEQRKADVIRARNAVRVASDRFKAIINDPQFTVGSETIIYPVDEMVEGPISYGLRDAIMTAIENRPEVQQAILSIDDASIRQVLADNQRLPLLNAQAEVAYAGLNNDLGGSYEVLNEGSFVDYLIGLVMEIPIGNRAAEAGYRKARLERSATIIAYRQAVQNVVLDVKTALRDVITNYELIQATRSFRVAQAENLRALLVEEETLAGLTPEFLNLKFQRQATLANARQQELLALVNFDQAVASLYRAMGIGLHMNRISLEVIDDPDAIRTAGDAADR